VIHVLQFTLEVKVIDEKRDRKESSMLDRLWPR
jgi:hypothetical protein